MPWIFQSSVSLIGKSAAFACEANSNVGIISKRISFFIVFPFSKIVARNSVA
jgi:hypothetical protein